MPIKSRRIIVDLSIPPSTSRTVTVSKHIPLTNTLNGLHTVTVKSCCGADELLQYTITGSLPIVMTSFVLTPSNAAPGDNASVSKTFQNINATDSTLTGTIRKYIDNVLVDTVILNQVIQPGFANRFTYTDNITPLVTGVYRYELVSNAGDQTYEFRMGPLVGYVDGTFRTLSNLYNFDMGANVGFSFSVNNTGNSAGDIPIEIRNIAEGTNHSLNVPAVAVGETRTVSVPNAFVLTNGIRQRYELWSNGTMLASLILNVTQMVTFTTNVGDRARSQVHIINRSAATVSGGCVFEYLKGNDPKTYNVLAGQYIILTGWSVNPYTAAELGTNTVSLTGSLVNSATFVVVQPTIVEDSGVNDVLAAQTEVDNGGIDDNLATENTIDDGGNDSI